MLLDPSFCVGHAGVSLWCAIFFLLRHTYYFEERRVIKAELVFADVSISMG